MSIGAIVAHTGATPVCVAIVSVEVRTGHWWRGAAWGCIIWPMVMLAIRDDLRGRWKS